MRPSYICIALPTGKRLQDSRARISKTAAALAMDLLSAIPVFFVTFCTYDRRKLLASDTVHTAFVSFATRAHLEQNVAVGRYVIMPDHLHFFVRRPDDLELGRWVGSAETNSCETDCASRHVADLAARLF